MAFSASALTLFAVFLPDLQSDWMSPGWIAMALLCICAWVLIAADIRNPRKSGLAADAFKGEAARVRSGGTSLII